MKQLRAPTAKAVVLGPVFPNVGVSLWYQSQLEALIHEAGADLIGMVEAAWRKTPPLFNSHIVSGEEAPALAYDAPSPTKALQAALQRWASQTIKRFDLAAQPLATTFASRSQSATQVSMMSQLRKAGLTIQFKPTTHSIEAYRAVAAENVALIKSIPRKWHEQIEQKVWGAVRNGYDLHTLSKELRDTYGSTTKRAALIARDQAAKAKAVIERERRKEYGIKRAIWMHSHAGEVPRPTHVEMDGKPYEIAQGMWDSAVQRFIWPGEEINCRCVDRAIIPGLEEEVPEQEEPTIAILKAGLRNAKHFKDKARGAEMRAILQEQRDGRSTWMGREQNDLRYEIDKFLSEG